VPGDVVEGHRGPVIEFGEMGQRVGEGAGGDAVDRLIVRP